MNAHGCDQWLGGRYCEVQDAPYVDDVQDERFCYRHAGPLAWDARDVNLYSLALRVAARARAQGRRKTSELGLPPGTWESADVEGRLEILDRWRAKFGRRKVQRPCAGCGADISDTPGTSTCGQQCFWLALDEAATNE